MAPIQLTLSRSWFPKSCDSVGSITHIHGRNRSFNDQLQDRGRPYWSLWAIKWYLSEPLVIMWYSLCFADTSRNPRCIGILLSHHHAHYTEILATDFVLLSRYCVPASPWCSHVCLDRWWLMFSNREGPKNISPSSEEQIPLSNYLVPCQTLWWVCKLSYDHRVTGNVWATPKSTVW